MNEQDNMLDWDEFEKYMVKQFPFIPKEYMKENFKRHPDWAGDYVQKLMKNFFKPSSGNFNPFSVKQFDYELFETHRSVFVRCVIPPAISPHDIRFSVGKRKLKIQHQDKTEEIALFSDVDASRSKAELKDDKLEIRIPKTGKRESYRDIPIYDY